MASVQKNKEHWGRKIIKYILDKVLSRGYSALLHNLEPALECKKDSTENLLETLIRMGALTREDLEATLECHNKNRYFDNSEKAHGHREFLGQLLLRAKLITPVQLAVALKKQKNENEKLGEVLVRLELLEKNELKAVLTFQQHLDEGILSNRFQLGKILIAEEYITRQQIEDVLSHQEISSKKIGEILIEAGHLQKHHLYRGLMLQQKLITTTLILWLSSPGMMGVQKAYAESSSGVKSTKISISATVIERTNMKILKQVQQVVLTDKDIMQGYVDITAASSIAVKSNNPRGYLLLMEVINGRNNYFDVITVRMGGKEVQLLPSGGYIAQPYNQGEVAADIGYRFALSKDAQPGTYSWPLMISVAPR